MSIRFLREWKENVYRAGKDKDFPEDWKKIWDRVRKRDNGVCQRCGTREGLSVHHIIPRSEGGTHDLFNLVLLCRTCHDLVEVAGYRSMWEIMNMGLDDPVEYTPIAPTDDWHCWVYGGYRNPRESERKSRK